VGLLLFGAYVSSIWLANWLLINVGDVSETGVRTIPVWLGIDAPSGVLAAGATLTLRDALQRAYGIRATVLAISVGSILSSLISPSLAFASGAAFLVAELLDMAVYTPLRQRYATAVVASNIVGAVADSAIFLLLAFGVSAALALAGPSALGKFEASVITLIILKVARAGLASQRLRWGRPS
jgi:uncharacterized PurR-regulated membrane protein YhhQ (DUF165 family)